MAGSLTEKIGKRLFFGVAIPVTIATIFWTGITGRFERRMQAKSAYEQRLESPDSTKIYVVQSDDWCLRPITRKLWDEKTGINFHDFELKIAELSGLDGKYTIHKGDTLVVPFYY